MDQKTFQVTGFDRYFDLRIFSFVLRDYINAKGPVEKWAAIPPRKRRDDWDYEPRPIDHASLEYLKSIYIKDSTKFVDLVRAIIYFHLDGRNSNSIRTAGSFWDHFRESEGY